MAQQTAKEKAEELVNKFIKPTIKWNPVNGVGYYNDLNAAKECAIVAADEIIPIVNSYENSLSASQQSNYLEYWYEVKEEIEKP